MMIWNPNRRNVQVKLGPTTGRMHVFWPVNGEICGSWLRNLVYLGAHDIALSTLIRTWLIVMGPNVGLNCECLFCTKEITPQPTWQWAQKKNTNPKRLWVTLHCDLQRLILTNIIQQGSPSLSNFVKKHQLWEWEMHFVFAQICKMTYFSFYLITTGRILCLTSVLNKCGST